MSKEKPNEYEKFDSTMRELIKIPHSEIKEKLEAEKASKSTKKGKKKGKTYVQGGQERQ